MRSIARVIRDRGSRRRNHGSPGTPGTCAGLYGEGLAFQGGPRGGEVTGLQPGSSSSLALGSLGHQGLCPPSYPVRGHQASSPLG